MRVITNGQNRNGHGSIRNNMEKYQSHTLKTLEFASRINPRFFNPVFIHKHRFHRRDAKYAEKFFNENN